MLYKLLPSLKQMPIKEQAELEEQVQDNVIASIVPIFSDNNSFKIISLKYKEQIYAM